MLLSEVQPSSLTDEQIDQLLFYTDTESVRTCDVAVLLGTAPKYAIHRAQIGALFYSLGGAERMIVTGAAVTDPTVTECEVMRRELVAQGVPQAAIIDEPHATTTVENMVYSLGAMSTFCDVTRIRRVTVITEPFHICRSLALSKAIFPRYMEVYGFTGSLREQRDAWKFDERLNRSVKNEISVLRGLIRDGVIADIEI